nr:hypothetical protein [Tanacetum cinerariifolium]
MPMYTPEFSLSPSMPTVRTDSPVEEVPTPKKKVTKRRQSKKVFKMTMLKWCIPWTTEEEIALCKAWVRISKDNVKGNERKNDGFYLEILDHMHTNCPNIRRRTCDMINGIWKTVRTKVAQFCGWRQRGRRRERGSEGGSTTNRAKKTKAKSTTSSAFSNKDLLARLMVNEFVDLTQTHKERKSKQVEAFIEIKSERWN